MKKLLALILVAVMCMSVLAACGGDDKKEETGNKGVASTTEPASEMVTDVFTIDNNVTDVSPEGENVIIDNDICVVEITSMGKEEFMGSYLELAIANKTEDTEISVSADYVAVNGVQRDAMLYTDVVAGKSAVEKVYFYDDLDDVIGEYTDVEIAVTVSKAEDYLADPLASTVYNYYPLGMENAVKFERAAEPTDMVLVDNDEVTVIVTGFEDDEIWGKTVNMYIVNKGNKNLMVTADDASVNSIMAEAMLATTVNGGKVAIDNMYWLDLEDKGITDVKDIEFTLRVYDFDDLFADDIVNQKVTLKP